MNSRRNCKNCGAPINPANHICEYCGTPYYDVVGISNDKLNILNVEVGDMPKEQVYKMLIHLKKIMDDKNITNVIYVPVFNNGKGRISVNE